MHKHGLPRNPQLNFAGEEAEPSLPAACSCWSQIARRSLHLKCMRPPPPSASAPKLASPNSLGRAICIWLRPAGLCSLFHGGACRELPCLLQLGSWSPAPSSFPACEPPAAPRRGDLAEACIKNPSLGPFGDAAPGGFSWEQQTSSRTCSCLAAGSGPRGSALVSEHVGGPRVASSGQGLPASAAELPRPCESRGMFLMQVRKQLCSLPGRQLLFHVKEEDLFSPSLQFYSSGSSPEAARR